MRGVSGSGDGLEECVIGHTYTVFAVSFQTVESLPVVEQVGAESLDTFMGLFLFGGNKLLFGGFGVIVYCSRQGRQGGGYLACSKMSSMGSPKLSPPNN